jgi:hypothetical protein
MPNLVSARVQFIKVSALAATLIVLAAGIGRGQQAAPPSIGDIQKAWQARQDRIRSGRFTWKEHRTWPKGSISAMFGPADFGRVPEAKGKIMPPSDKTVDFSYVLRMDNDKMRFEYEGREWSNVKQDFRPIKYLSVFNGTTMKDVNLAGLGDADWPQGAIRKGERFRDAGLAALLPLILVYRPLVPSLKPTDDLRAMTRLNRQKVLDGRPCVELVQRFPTSSTHIWVDSTRDFVLARRLVIDQGKPVEQIDIHYRNDAALGWVPTSWKIVNHHHDGKLFCSINAELATTEFNLDAEPGLFDFEFPPGTLVSDEKKREHYVLRRDGTKRAIVGKELSSPYEKLLDSDSDATQLPTKPLASRWALAIVIAVGLTALGILVWRRLRLRRSLHHERG